MKKFTFLFVGILIFCSLGIFSRVQAITCDDTMPTDNADLLKEFSADCSAKQAQFAGQAQTLGQALDMLNIQIKLTQAKIAAATIQLNDLNAEINDLSGKIDSIDYSLTDLTKTFVSRVRETYMYPGTSNVVMLTESSGLSDLIRTVEYAKRVRDYDRNILVSLEKSRLDFDAQKQAKEEKQKEVAALQQKLSSDKTALASQVTAKNQLLADTRNNETKYQQLLTQAQAQLASLANFAESVGISLIPHQDLSDSWGKYYNQRDANWGNMLINTQGSGCGGACSVAKVGCLVTSYAMVASHYGGSSSPGDVATNGGDFFPGTALFNSPGPSANGHNATDVNDPSLQQLRDALNSGKVIIAGLSINGGPAKSHFSDHWVVLRSVDGDSFRINDPEYPGAMNVSLKDNYGSWTIIQAKIYN